MYTSNYVEKFRQVIMSRFREVNAEKGHVLPQAWLTPFLSKMNVKRKAFFEQAMQQLQAESLIEYQKKDDAHHHIMQQGEDYLYPDFKVADARQKIRNDILAKFKANQNKTIACRCSV